MGPSREPLLTRAFVLGFVANFLHTLALHSYLHLPGYLRGLDATATTIGWVMGAMSISAIGLRPLIGRLLDTRGRRFIVLVGSVFNVVFSAAYLTVDHVGPWIFVVRLGHGLAQAMLFSALFTVAADIVPRSRRTEGIALYGVSGMIPLSLAGLIGDGILAHAGYRELFGFTVIAALAGAAAAWFVPDSRPDPSEGDAPSRSFFAAVSSRSLRPVWLAGFSFAFAVASYFAFLKAFVLEREVGSVGLFFTAYTIAAVGLRVAFGWVPDKVGPTRVLIPAIVCLAIGVGTLAVASNALLVGLAGTLCGIGHGYAFPITSALVVVRSRPSERGVGLAAFSALFDVGLLVGAPSLGLLLELTDYTTMFSAAAALAAAGAVGFVIWDRRVPHGPS